MHCTDNSADKMRCFMDHILFQREKANKPKSHLLQVGNVPSPLSSQEQTHKTNGSHPLQPLPTILSVSLLPQIEHFLSVLLPTLFLSQLSFKSRFWDRSVPPLQVQRCNDDMEEIFCFILNCKLYVVSIVRFIRPSSTT